MTNFSQPVCVHVDGRCVRCAPGRMQAIMRALMLCCGGDDNAVVEPRYRESLLGAGGTTPRTTPRGAATSTSNTSTSNVRPAFTEQLVYVMRHGHRQDEEDDCWHVNAARPWDPPLSALGREQVG